MSTEARLKRLEKELAASKRRFRRLGILVLGLAAAGMALAWTGGEGISGPAQEVVRAERFVLQDGDGTIRGVWDASGAEVGMGLYDQTEEIRVSLALSATGPQLHLADETRELRVQLAVTEIGPSLYLYDQTGQIRTQLGVGTSQTPEGRTTTYPESSLRLAGPDGKLIWSAP